MPNVGPYIYDVSISGFTRSSIYIYIYDISSLRVKLMDIGFLTMLEFLVYLKGSDIINRNFVPKKKFRESVNIRNTNSFFFFFKVRKSDPSSTFFQVKFSKCYGSNTAQWREARPLALCQSSFISHSPAIHLTQQ